MREEKKISTRRLAARLQTQMNYKKPARAFDNLLRGWCRHKRFHSPTYGALLIRRKTDGSAWLKDDEIPSLEAYIGYKLT